LASAVDEAMAALGLTQDSRPWAASNEKRTPYATDDGAWPDTAPQRACFMD